MIIQNDFAPLPGNVLVVEDDLGCGTMIVSTLSDNGYGVRLVRTRNDAVVAMKRYLYEYILLDVRMPGMEMADFLTAVSSSAARNARIILMTAETNAAEEAQKHHIPFWLGKPFGPEQLLKLMATIKIFKQPPDRDHRIFA